MYITIINDIIQNVFLTGHIKNRYPHYAAIYTRFFSRPFIFSGLSSNIFVYYYNLWIYLCAHNDIISHTIRELYKKKSKRVGVRFRLGRLYARDR